MKGCRLRNCLLLICVTASIILFAATAMMAAGSIQAFTCDLIPADQYKLDQNSIIFYKNYKSRYYDYPGPYGPYAIRTVPLPSEASPLNHKDVKLNRLILFDDHEVSLGGLFLSTEDALYECGGSPPNGDERIVE